MIRLTQRLMEMIESGREGNNMGLSTGIKKLDDLIYGVQRKWIYVVGAASGGGKTTFSLYSFVYQPLVQMLGNPKLKIIFFALEMSSEVLMAKLLSLHILYTYGIKVEYKEILSLGTKLTDEKYALIKDSAEWLAQVEQHLIIYDKPVNADGVNDFLIQYLNLNGSFVELSDTQITYKPNIENAYTIVLVDHVRLLQGKPKEEIDKLCDYLVYLRNVASITAVLIQQINRDSQSMDRRKAGYYLIQQSDLADSSAPAQSAETILALFHPFREQLTTSCGYDITKMGDYCRILQCIKGRYGESDKAIGLSFYGSVGAFKQLPRPDQISDYEKYKTIEFFMEKDEKKIDIEKPDKQKGYSFGDYPD